MVAFYFAEVVHSGSEDSFAFSLAFSALGTTTVRLCFLGPSCGSISLIPLSCWVHPPQIHKFITQSHRGSKRHGPQATTGHFAEPPCDPAYFSPTGTTYTDLSAGISRDDQPLPAHPDNLHRLCGSLTSAHSGTCTSPM